MDLSVNSVRRIPTVIYVDTHRITIEQGSRIYLDVTSRLRQPAAFVYEVLDLNDQKCTAVFSFEQRVFDFYCGSYRIRYLIDSVHQKDDAELIEVSDEPAEPADSVAEDNRIYLNVEVMPEFPGGAEALKAWLAERVRYPAAARREGIKGLVEVTAVVEKDGTLSDVRLVRDIGGGCGQEALQAVKAMPKWIPGSRNGELKRVRISIKIFFPPK